MDMLNNQGDQLNRVEGHLDTINNEMKEADKALTGMEKWCGLFVCPWNKYKEGTKIFEYSKSIWRVKKGEDGGAAWEEASSEKTVVRHQPPSAVNRDQRDAPTGPYVERYVTINLILW